MRSVFVYLYLCRSHSTCNVTSEPMRMVCSKTIWTYLYNNLCIRPFTHWSISWLILFTNSFLIQTFIRLLCHDFVHCLIPSFVHGISGVVIHGLVHFTHGSNHLFHSWKCSSSWSYAFIHSFINLLVDCYFSTRDLFS